MQRQLRHQGGCMGGHLLPVRGSAPPHLPSQSEEKNSQNKPLSANFSIFATSESHFAPSMPPYKKKNSGAATEQRTICLKMTNGYQNSHNRCHAGSSRLTKGQYIWKHYMATYFVRRAIDQHNALVGVKGQKGVIPGQEGVNLLKITQ